MILTFGILGLLVCIIFAILAWVMGNGDLREMDAGRMDPTGRGITQAGKILGMVAVILALVGLLIYVVVFVILGVALAGGAAAGAGG